MTNRIGSAHANWEDGANWSPAGAPGDGDTAIVSDGSTATLVLDGVTTISSTDIAVVGGGFAYLTAIGVLELDGVATVVAAGSAIGLLEVNGTGSVMFAD